jgi:O-antigen/teichoic acid export membrane protein
VVTLPLTAFLGLGADVWVRWVAGDAFGPSAIALRILAPVLVLNYVGIVSAQCLYLLGRSWRVTVICLVGLAVNAGLNVALIPPFVHWRAGGGGIAASLATVGTELFVTTCFLFQMGRRILDRRLLVTVGTLAGVSVATLGLHCALVRFGPARLVADGLAFVALSLALGAVRPAELRAFLRTARR